MTYVDEKNAFSNDMNELSLRMQLTLMQASGSGLTSYKTIKIAIATATTFPWGRAAQLIPVDFQNFVQAIHHVGDNDYFGFAKDLGVVRFTLYKSH